ncbi:hypothetical protein IGI04_007730 [Brassica rapa subsp. trilocularis]|uniref:Uncharacterized protein n=1 Tax=Brassica rapa subsp. trilocularis TaxID=1813537 RepID=A0ABQ7NMM2_BRACM|nr:hypothetical protein IGI04_007730 [Brassica rapa subsp. trilocularis]
MCLCFHSSYCLCFTSSACPVLIDDFVERTDEQKKDYRCCHTGLRSVPGLKRIKI